MTLPKGAVAGDKITVKDQNGKEYPHTLTQADITAGKVTVQVDKPPHDTELKVTATIENAGGVSEESAPDQAVIDEQGPSVSVHIENGKVTFTFSEPVLGFDESDILISGGQLVPGSLKQNPDGTWTAEITGTTPGKTVTVDVTEGSYTDTAGNAGSTGTDEDISIKINSIYPDTVGGGSVVTGITKPGNEVTLKVPGSDQEYTVIAGSDGKWSITTDTPLKDGDQITVTTPNADQTAADSVPLPFVSIDVVSGDDFINEGELKAPGFIDEQGRITITGKVSNPSADMTITFNGKTYSGNNVTVSPDGTWSIKVPVEDVNLNGKNDVTAGGVVTDSTGQTFPSNDASSVVGTDTTPPKVQVDVTPDGKITIQFDKDVDPSSIETGKITITDKNGNPITVTLTPSQDGLTFTGQVPEGVDSTVTVTVPGGSYNDINGNKGEPGQDKADVDTDAPQVTVDIDPNGNITITYPDDVDPSTIETDKITITDKDGNPITVTLTPGSDGLTFTGKVPDGVDSTVTVTVPNGSYQDITGNPGGPGTDSETVDTKAPALVVTLNPDGTVRFEFSEVVKGFTSEDILVGGANLIPGSLVDLGNGVWTAKLDSMPTDGTTAQVTVKDNTYTDLNGNKGSGDSDEVITIKINSVTPNSQGGTTVEGMNRTGFIGDFFI